MTLAQLAFGSVVNLVIVSPLFRPPGFLVNGAGREFEMGVAVVLAIIAGLLTVGIAVTVQQVVRRHASAWGLWLIAMAAATLALTAVEQTHNAALASLSRAHGQPGAPAALDTVYLALVTSRHWSHYVALIVAGSTILSMYAALWRTSLVPRALAWVGMASAALYVATVTLPILGRGVIVALLVPLPLSQIALSLWLLVRGFAEPHGEGSSLEATGPA